MNHEGEQGGQEVHRDQITVGLWFWLVAVDSLL